MAIIGLDLHKRETQLCRQRPDGRIVDERIPTSRRHLRAELIVRDTLVHTRTRCIAVCKTSVRRDGLRVPSGASETIAARIAALDLASQARQARQAPTLGAELAPLLAQLPALTTAISAARL